MPVVDDAEKEEAGETGTPEHDEEGVDDLTSMVVAGEQRLFRQRESKFVAPCEVWKGPGVSKGLPFVFHGEFRDLLESLSNFSENAIENSS